MKSLNRSFVTNMARPLPYPGHSWPFTQHAVGFDAKILYALLECAAPFEGSEDGYTKKITNLMVAADVLTANHRNGVADAWRDYQQLLSELGLIISTKISKKLTITELGQMYLAGEIGFSELIGMQALRYQYPNGQKFDISMKLKTALGSHIAGPKNLIALQIQNQVLIKPGTLILRILLEVFRKTGTSSLSTSECQAFLVPCHSNDEWALALHEIEESRKLGKHMNGVHPHARRNVQDWFKFLDKSDFFELDSSRNLCLSDYSIKNYQAMLENCKLQEKKESFWTSENFDKKSRVEWFSRFGHVPFSEQSTLRSVETIDEDYILKNYAAGIEDELEDADFWSPRNSLINLTEINTDHLGKIKPPTLPQDIEIVAENIRRGVQKRLAKTTLHDRIIKELAEKFASQGAVVQSDPDSIDLFAKWKDGTSAIFEVKTVTRRSLPVRLRTAIGQIEEYAYRQKESSGVQSDKVIVLNTEIESDAWQIDFLKSHMCIGLVCSLPSKRISYASNSQKSSAHWLG